MLATRSRNEPTSTSSPRSACLRAKALPSALIVALALVTLPQARTARAIPHAQTTPTPTPTPRVLPDPAAPCELDGERSVWPDVVEEGHPITVTVRIRYDCTAQAAPATNLIFVIEDTTDLVDRQLPAAQRDAQLAIIRDAFLALLERGAGNPASRIALIDGSSGAPFGPLAAGPAAFATVRDGLASLRADGACHRRSASLAAAKRLVDEAGLSEPGTMVVYIATSAPPCADGGVVPPPTTESCSELARSATIAWIAHDRQTARPCPGVGWYYRSNGDPGAMPEIVDDITRRLFDEDRPTSLHYDDAFDQFHFAYEIGSGRPEPDSRGLWPLATIGIPAASHTIQFRLIAERAPAIGPVSLPPGPALAWTMGSTSTTWHLPNPRVCIHRPTRRAQDCPDWPEPPPQPTTPPRAATMTPVATSTMLPRVPTATRVVVPANHRVYFPLSISH